MGIGTETSPGTKVFALTGKVKNTGLVEVPMGITLREIIYDIGGGIMGDKAVQGRPDRRAVGRLHPEPVSSTCRWTSTRSHRVGSMMGSGGMVVLDEETCMVDIAKYFLSFTQARVLRQVPTVPDRHGTCLRS